ASLDKIYTQDRARILRRARLILSESVLMAAASETQGELRRGLAKVLRKAGAVRGELEADVLAGARAAALESAGPHWGRGGGRIALRHAVRRSLGYLSRL